MRKIFLIIFLAVLLLLSMNSLSLAQEVAGSAAQPGFGTKELIFGTLQFFCLGLFVYYMLVILPRNAQESDHKKFLEGLKKNDEVVTTGGFLGRVVAVKPEYITVELGANTKVRVLPKYVKAVNTAKSSASGGENENSASGVKKKAKKA